MCSGVGHAVVCARVYFAAVFPEPFSKSEYKQRSKQIQNETMRDSKIVWPLVSAAVVKHELIDWTVITGTL